MKFILVGDGFPVVQTLELLLGYKQAEVLQVFTSSQEGKKSKVELMAEEAGISVHPSSFMGALLP